MTAEAERTRDELLAMRCQLGEPLAFLELVETMERRLFCYIRRFLDDDDDAADVLQEVWVTVFQKVRRLKDAGALRPLDLPRRPRPRHQPLPAQPEGAGGQRGRARGGSRGGGRDRLGSARCPQGP